jgi:class 3 adenylate cyclase/tetratricopeptide (TPR) repeat protein
MVEDDELSITHAFMATIDPTSSAPTPIKERCGLRRRSLSDSDLISSVISASLIQQSRSLGVDLLYNSIVSSADNANEESLVTNDLNGSLGMDPGTGQDDLNTMCGPEGPAFVPTKSSSFRKQGQKTTSREKSETKLRQSLAKLVDYKQESSRTLRLREHFSVGTGVSRMHNGVTSSRSSRIQLKSSLSLSDEELKEAAMAPPLSGFSRSKTAIGYSQPLPPPGLFRSKTAQSVMSSFDSSGDASTRTGRFARDDPGSLPEELARTSRRHHLLLQRHQLTDSLAWFCSHVPRCVMQDLAFHELSLISLEAESGTKRGDERTKLRSSTIMTKARSLLDEDSDGDHYGPKPRRISSVKPKQSLPLSAIQISTAPSSLDDDIDADEPQPRRFGHTRPTKPELLSCDREDNGKPELSPILVLGKPTNGNLLDNNSDDDSEPVPSRTPVFGKLTNGDLLDDDSELEPSHMPILGKLTNGDLMDNDSDDDSEPVPSRTPVFGKLTNGDLSDDDSELEPSHMSILGKLTNGDLLDDDSDDGCKPEVSQMPILGNLTNGGLLNNDSDSEMEMSPRRMDPMNMHEPSLWDDDSDVEHSRLKSCPRISKKTNLLDDASTLSSLSDDGIEHVGAKASDDASQSRVAAEIISSFSMPQNALPLPYTVKRDCALLFVDITGFTKLSTLLDVESLSKVINAYFRMIVDEVVNYGGDILKFAGDAFFAEWRITSEDDFACDAENLQRQRKLRNHPLSRFRRSFKSAFGETKPEWQSRSLSECVLAASMCAASMVEKYSDFEVPHARDLSISFGKEQQSDAMLNVHCGIGVGTLVGLHVGDHLKTADSLLAENRREYLFLGDPIDQVSKATDVATDGEVLASPEAVLYLADTCHVPDDMLSSTEPVLIASRNMCRLRPKVSTRKSISESTVVSKASQQTMYHSLVAHCKDLDEPTLARLHRQLALYVHPVLRGDDLAANASMHGGPAFTRSKDASQSRHRAEAELRTVYTMFIKAVMPPKLSGIDETDRTLYSKLQNIMQVVCRELNKYRGHLRQFIVDDKGVVLIATFGLRGSTFANMVANHALPATFAIHTALKSELKVENRIGASFGKVYCGVVGGIGRHEFAVMGAGVNLAARLMYSPTNNGILVDEAVQAHADARFAFKSLPPVRAKGYDNPVIIFEPLHAVYNKKRGNAHGHIGRRREVEELTDVAKNIMEDKLPSPTIMAFFLGESGMGKTALGHCVSDETKKYAKEHSKRVIIARSTSTETEQRIPLSSFKKIFLGAIKELCLHDGTLSRLDEPQSGPQPRALNGSATRRGSLSRLGPRRRMSTGRATTVRRAPSMRMLTRIDSSHSVSSMKSQIQMNVPYLQKLCDICEELNYPYEYADIVGSQLLGLDGALPQTHVEGHIPTIDEVVDFLTKTYIRLTDFSDLIVIFLDDFQWIDSLTWKVIRVLCQRGKNILMMGAMLSQETQALRRMSSVGTWHEEMKSRILEFPLGSLDLSEVKETISKVLGFEDCLIDDSLCSDIYQRTGGLPLYAIELLESIKRKKTVAIDKESGMLRWTPEAQREQDRMGSNSVAMIELSFLERFDALDATVRRVLQTCAVLGISFSLSDVIRVHPELEETIIEKSLNAAVDELILIEDIEGEEDDDMSLWSVDESMADQSKATWNTTDDRFFQFSHAMWRKSVLDAMLKEQKIHLHQLIAEAMETEQVVIMESSDIGRLLTLFDHWKSCGKFSKAAPLALAVGLRLEEWDLSAQSLDVYQDVLEMCYESADRADEEQEAPQDGNDLWVHASAPTTTLEFILRLYIRIAKCHAHLGEQEQCKTTFEDAYRIISTSTEATRFNGELLLLVLSGLCSISIQSSHFDDESISEQKELLNKFIAEAKRHERVFHLCRALAMEASFYARLGQFKDALVSTEMLLAIYDVEDHSAAIREDYGKDYAAQALADSTEWLCLVDEKREALARADYVIETLLPHFDPRQVDAIMELTFPVVMVMKALDRSVAAEATLFNNVINPYHDSWGSASFWVKFFNPFAYLMEIIKMEAAGKYDMGTLTAIENWALEAESSIFASGLQRRGNRIVGEICARLSRLKLARGEDAEALLERGRLLLARVVFACDADKSDSFLISQARELYRMIDDDSEDEDDAPSRDKVQVLHRSTEPGNHGSYSSTTSPGVNGSSRRVDAMVSTPTQPMGPVRCFCTLL